MRRSRLARAGFAACALVVAACSDDDDNSEATLEFHGDDCLYSGPTKFDNDDEFEITASDITEERMDVGFGVVPVPDGASVAELR